MTTKQIEKSVKRLEKYIAKIVAKDSFYISGMTKTNKEEKRQNFSYLMEHINPKFRKKIGVTVGAVFEDENGGTWLNDFFI